MKDPQSVHDEIVLLLTKIGVLEKENARLQGVLKKIAGLSGGGDCCSAHGLLELARLIASAALAKKEEKG